MATTYAIGGPVFHPSLLNSPQVSRNHGVELDKRAPLPNAIEGSVVNGHASPSSDCLVACVSIARAGW